MELQKEAPITNVQEKSEVQMEVQASKEEKVEQKQIQTEETKIQVEQTMKSEQQQQQKDVKINDELLKQSQIIYMYGSCESDQFFIDGNRMHARKPFQLTYFIQNKISINKIVAGAMHTLALSTVGKLYSWGCNDDFALGRITEDDSSQQPMLVNLPCSVDLISAGDSHSVASNSIHALVFYWGNYRHTLQGNMAPPQKLPKQIGEEEFKGKIIKKVLSGSNHSLVLADDKLYAWGDPDTFVLGYMPTKRRRIVQALKVELIYKKVMDVFTGASHSFLKVVSEKKKQDPTFVYYAWGLNQYGQLGIGTNQHTFRPTIIEELKGKNILNIVGGEHSSLALTDKGEVFVWGRNDDGQLGLGEKWYENEAYIQKIKGKLSQKQKEKPNDNNQNQPDQSQQNQYLSRPDSIYKPVQNKFLSKIVEIYGGSNYSYAISGEGQMYSWGMGDNYVLATREEDTIYEPQPISLDQFVQRPLQFGLAAQHVACLCSNNPKHNEEFSIPKDTIEKIDEKLLKLKKKVQNKPKKNSISESNNISEQSNQLKRSVEKLETQEEKDEIQSKLKKSFKKN